MRLILNMKQQTIHTFTYLPSLIKYSKNKTHPLTQAYVSPSVLNLAQVQHVKLSVNPADLTRVWDDFVNDTLRVDARRSTVISTLQREEITQQIISEEMLTFLIGC